jgi:seryl-tRNA synthetase
LRPFLAAEDDMLDIKWIRANPGALDAALGRRGTPAAEDTFRTLDAAFREARTAGDAARSRANEIAAAIGAAMRSGNAAGAAALKAEAATLKADLAGDLPLREREAGAALQSFLDRLPNVPRAEVPTGTDESGNVEVRRRGVPRAFGFPPLDHVALGERLGLDLATATAMSGARFALLRGSLARLERALGQFMLDLHVREHGCEEVSPPLLVGDAAMRGTGQLPKFADDLFRAGEGGWLVPTAEVPLTNMVAGRILAEADLPMRLVALTPCFRAEAGAAGRDVGGLIRLHQFPKCELVTVCTPDRAEGEHARMLACAETVLDRLEIPYRTVELCTGDMGFSAARTYDIEAWLPAQGRYREISSVSTCGDFQARRLDARHRPAGGGAPVHVHTLNGSGVAVGRALVALLENHQREDGSIDIPSALRPHMGGIERIVPA